MTIAPSEPEPGQSAGDRQRDGGRDRRAAEGGRLQGRGFTATISNREVDGVVDVELCVYVSVYVYLYRMG